MATREIPFRPKIEGEFRTRFYNAVSQIKKDTSSTEIEKICAAEITWVESECVVNIIQRRKYRAAWYLFRDLVRASWKAEFKDGTLFMRLIELDEPDDAASAKKEAKDLIRGWMQESRREKIIASSDFIKRMESDAQDKRDISHLIADGAELAERLEKIKTGELDVTDAVQPYLQLVTDSGPDSIDPFTRQRIADIWRYFRMTWSTPAESTPGRTMQYLIRDAAHPMHAVMGLASLENCAVAITCRDEYIGWTLSALIKKIKSGEATPLAAYQRLITYLNEGIESIDYSDLCSEVDIQNPSASVIDRLITIAADSDNQRQTLIKGGASSAKNDEQLLENDNARSDESVTLLFKHKRAEQLAKNLSALVALRQAISRPDFEAEWEKISGEDSVSTAIRTALSAQKSKHIGTSMLELNVCGAIPPYNEVLGGKLVALLAVSPQIVEDYRKRYGGRKSEIASKLKGEDVCRPADLVYVGTTSLYSIGSSQYNRLKIPKDAIDAKMNIQWKKLGSTTGYGTLHISRATALCLKEVMGENNKINHIFGEGPSPKMRLLAASIRDLLETSYEDTKEFTKHAMSRIVYGAKLACNTSSYMLGVDRDPVFYFAEEDSAVGTSSIIRFWQHRWLAHRIAYLPIFDRLRSFDKTAILISKEISQKEEWHYEKLSDRSAEKIVVNDTSCLQFVRDLYRGKSAFADGVRQDDLKSIHVGTRLDSAICKIVSQGKDVVLTGNPGDGKTHIIRILEEQLASSDYEVELDASTKTNNDLFNHWQQAHANSKPFVLAINAAVLHSLYESHSDYQPIAEAYEQMIHAVNHDESVAPVENVVVFDLSNREILTPEIINAVIAKLTDDCHYIECANCPLGTSCPVDRNRRLIQTELFKQRLYAIAERAILKGHHATVRELQAFVSYLIFGDRDCSMIARTTGNNDYEVVNLVYSGRGKLFDAFRESFDPVFVSHPSWDEKILMNAIAPDTWEPGFVPPVETIDAYNLDEFNLRKRQFYFFNRNGQVLLDILDDDIASFQHFLQQSDKAIIKDVISKLNAFFGRTEKNELMIWSGHRYNNSPRNVLISTGSMKAKKFVVSHPRLLPAMKAGIDMAENYLRFSPKDCTSVFLKIDFAMFSFLSAAERGVPVLYMESVMTKRVWRFVEQLQRCVEQDDDAVEVSLFDIQNKMEYKVEIDLDEKKYTAIKRVPQKD